MRPEFKLTDEQFANDADPAWATLTEDEILEEINNRMIEDAIPESERLRRDNPTLQAAWEQIQTIKALTESDAKKREINYKKEHENKFFDILDGIETENTALKEAWDKYYTLKMLITGKT